MGVSFDIAAMEILHQHLKEKKGNPLHLQYNSINCISNFIFRSISNQINKSSEAFSYDDSYYGSVLELSKSKTVLLTTPVFFEAESSYHRIP